MHYFLREVIGNGNELLFLSNGPKSAKNQHYNFDDFWRENSNISKIAIQLKNAIFGVKIQMRQF